MGIFGDMFDFNHDGKLDAFEQAAEFSYEYDGGRRKAKKGRTRRRI